MYEIVHEGRPQYSISQLGNRVGECELLLLRRIDNVFDRAAGDMGTHSHDVGSQMAPVQ